MKVPNAQCGHGRLTYIRIVSSARNIMPDDALPSSVQPNGIV